MTVADLQELLAREAEESYRQFAASLIPGETKLLGVRLPTLRRLAKQAAKGEWRTTFAELKGHPCMELVMLRGMLPGYANCSRDERLQAIAEFVPDIRNWSICDSCCATYHFVREQRYEILPFLHSYLASPHEYEARFGVVMLLMHYMKAPEWISTIAALLPTVTAEGFYARMAVAWCTSELYFSNPQAGEQVLKQLSSATQRLAEKKIRESRKRV